jgi:hypothetical protein
MSKPSLYYHNGRGYFTLASFHPKKIIDKKLIMDSSFHPLYF